MRILFYVLLLCYSVAYPQAVSGVAKDAATGNPLPFATITPEGASAIISEVDGKFTVAQRPSSFSVSYVGYSTITIPVVAGKNFYAVMLEQHTEELGEVIVQNPALAIVHQAILRKATNDPRQKLQSYRYKSYEKLIVTANPDSISGKLDSVFAYEKAGRRLEKIDSSFFKFKRIVERQHLYQTEKLSEFSFDRDQGEKQLILGTRMAGFKKPLYEFIALSLVPTSVYAKNIMLMETRYPGPLADNAFRTYKYRVLDTLAIEGRTTYMVYFTPRHKTAKRMDGLIYLDAVTYSVARAVFRVRNVLDITAEQRFTYDVTNQVWFPSEQAIKVVKGNNKQDIKILGETIKFDGMGNERREREREPSDYVYLFSQSRNFDNQYNIPLNLRRPSVAIEVTDEAIGRPESFWDHYRNDSLDVRSITTYTALDSLVEKDNWEQRIILGRRIINGYLPVSFFDIDLRQLVKYNNYEGFRVGLGGTTNDKFSEIFRISTYGAYGTKDGQFKYSLGSAVRVGRFSASWIGGSYTDDVREIGSTSFATDKRVFKIYDPRPINITTFYNYQSWQGYIETRIIPKTESVWQLTRSRIDPKFNYLYTPGDKVYQGFYLTTATAALQWNPFSEYMQTPAGRIETEKRFPKFAFQYTLALRNIAGSNLSFSKFDFRVEYEKKYLNGQKTSLLFQSGLAIGDTPLTHLYSTSPNNLDRDAILKRVTLAGKNSFETMYFNEFFSSRYAIFQALHAFPKFTIINKIKLAPVLVSRAAWGTMARREDHAGVAFNTLENGYYESGLECNEIFHGLGLSAFYRYGPYHLPTFDRNISVKLSFVLSLGF